MDSGFKIIAEETMPFKKKDRLYVVMTKEIDNYGVEVMGAEEGYGRRYSKNKPNVELVFEALTKKLSLIKDYTQAIEAVKFIFSFDKLSQVYFSIKVEGTTISQADIGKLMRKVKFDVTPLQNMAGKTRKQGWITIKVSLEKKELGEFIGKRYGDNFKFTFY